MCQYFSIQFPDPRAPRKGQVSIYGTLDGVFAARQQLLGCLPLVLMFDLPDENGKSIRDGTEFLVIRTHILVVVCYISNTCQPHIHHVIEHEIHANNYAWTNVWTTYRSVHINRFQFKMLRHSGNNMLGMIVNFY